MGEKYSALTEVLSSLHGNDSVREVKRYELYTVNRRLSCSGECQSYSTVDQHATNDSAMNNNYIHREP